MWWTLAAFAWFPLSQAQQCQGEAFALPIQDVLVEPNITNSYMIGIPVTVGTPAQNVVMLPWAELNNTYLYDQNAYCDSTVIFDDTICRVRRGNFYLESSSSSWNQAVDLSSAGGASSETLDPAAEAGIKNLVGTALGGSDTINFAETGPLSSFPIGIPRQQWDNGYSTLHPLGLGFNSTYLNTLYSAGKIASRTWSLYWGRMWTTNNPINGQLVLGGLDERKINGQNYTQKINYNLQNGCFTGLKVNIIDIQLNFRGGVDKSLMPGNTAIPTCIVPTRQLLLEADGSFQTLFMNVTGTKSYGNSFDFHWSFLLFDNLPGKVYDGDITIVLDSGLSVRVPNDQFVVPPVSIDRNGSRVFNDSAREVLLGAVHGQATLGRYFLTAAYLSVNHDEDTFTLWNANPTTATSLKTISNNRTCTSSNSDPSSNAANPSSTSSTSSSTSLDKPKSSTTLSKAAIIGTTVGAIALLVLASIAILIFVYRRRHTPKLPRYAPTLPPKEDHSRIPELHDAYGSSYSSYTGAKLSGLGVNQVELHGEVAAVPEIDGRKVDMYELGWHTPRSRESKR